MVLPALLIGTAGCKKKKPPEKAPEVVEVQRVESTLQVTALQPTSVMENTIVRGTLYGSGFTEGVAVQFGTRTAGDVTVVDPNTLELELPELAAGTYDVTVSQGEGSTTLRGALEVRGAETSSVDCTFLNIPFGYNSASISNRNQLDDFMPCYQQRSGTVRIAGHADERGTTDYNLALGQRRADVVRRYLSEQGVSSQRLQTVSYGEEKPVQGGSNEAAWSANRRAEVESR